MARSFALCCAAALVLGCVSESRFDDRSSVGGAGGGTPDPTGGAQGPAGAGGAPAEQTGGGAGETPATGGVATGTGGSEPTGGWAPETGGYPATGGVVATGGELPTGGVEESGGIGGGEEACSPGDRSCLGSSAVFCHWVDDTGYGEAGYGWDLWEDCQHGCLDGLCQPAPPPPCELGARECRDGSVYQCAIGGEDPDGWVHRETCNADFGCHEGYCNECVPNSWWCPAVGSRLLAGCQDQGRGYVEEQYACTDPCRLHDEPTQPLITGICQTT